MLKGQRGVVHILVPLILLGGIIVAVYLIQTGNLKLFPKAVNPPIVFKNVDGSSLLLNSSGVPVSTSSNVRIELTSTLGPPATTYPTPSYTYPTPSTYSTPYATPSYATPSYGTPPYSYPTPTTPSPSPSPSPTPTPTPTPTAMRVFVTSTTYNGNLGGLSGADQKCQTTANNANLGGTWKAWISDSRTSASSRLNHYNGPYRNLQNSILLSNWADLVDGSYGPRINVDEFKSTKTGYAWTNTDFKGDLIATTNTIGGANGHCADWISTTPTISGGVGSIENYSFNTKWTSTTVISCTQQASLYCFEQPTSGVQGVTGSSYLTPSGGGVSGPITTGTVSYKIAENPTDLDKASFQDYTKEPTILDYTFQDTSLGQKFIWVEFIGSDGTTDRKSAQIEIVSPTPTYITPYETPYSYPTPPIPSPSPIPGPFSNLSASLTSGRAEFNFTYDNLSETLFKLHLSETKDFSIGVYYNFVTGSVSPLIETDVGKMSQYQCNKTLYWKVEAVYTGGYQSPIQPATINCEPSPPAACTINQFAASFGSRRGDGKYIPTCDINDDGVINIFDILDLIRRQPQ